MREVIKVIRINLDTGERTVIETAVLTESQYKKHITPAAQILASDFIKKFTEKKS